MQLLTWNCNQAFRRKQSYLDSYDPDILVIPECENPATKGDWSSFEDWVWIGNNPNQGLGVFTRNELTIDETTEVEGVEYCLFVETNRENLLAVWAKNDSDNPAQRYIGQLYTALKEYPEVVGSKSIVAGDLNWNVIWDEDPNSSLVGDFAETRAILNEHGLYSAYHHVNGEGFGEETAATFYMHKREDRPYHIDYVFMPEQLLDAGCEVTIGDYEDWIDASDHMPVMVEC